MTDRELLEAAALAAGIALARWVEHWADDDAPSFQTADLGSWNPLTDDGDALRLAVKLELRVTVIGSGMAEAKTDGGKSWFEHDAAGDTAAATRRAIVRAAAAMSEDTK